MRGGASADRARAAHSHRVGWSVPHLGCRSGLARHRGRSAEASDLDDGQEDHGRFRHARQQGARSDRSAFPLLCVIQSSRYCIHPQSVIHGFAEFVDGSVLAQVGFPTMELPILYALTYPDRVPDQGVRRFDPVAAGTLTFEALQPERFPAYVVGREAARQGGTAPARFNAANEVAVQLFLEERIAFGRIAEIIERVVGAGSRESGAGASLENVLAADAEARRLA